MYPPENPMGIQTNKHAKNADRRCWGAESSIRGEAKEINGPEPMPAITRNARSMGKDEETAAPKLPAEAKKMPRPTRRRAFVEVLR